MSINCELAFTTNNVTRIVPSSIYNGSIQNQFVGAFFKFDIIGFETVFFELRLQPNTTNAINVEFKLFRRIGETFLNLGASISDDFVNTFEYSAEPGEYFICITSFHSINFSLISDFTDVSFPILGEMNAYSGEETFEFEFARETFDCNSPVFYQIIEGELPTGLTLRSDGIISGVPIEQDCEEYNKNEPPSFTWFKETVEGNSESTSRDYKVIIRAALIDSPSTYDDREFLICVHNNWNNDKESFQNSTSNFEQDVFEIEGKESWFDVKPIEPSPTQGLDILIDDKCNPCNIEHNENITLEEIKQLCENIPIQINNEFNNLIELDNDGLCVVKPNIENDDFNLVEKIDEVCTPCEEPIISEILLDKIPNSLCKIEEIVLESKKESPFTKGIANICYPELLNRMFNDKVCDDYHSCDSKTPIYKQIDDENGDILPKTLCNKDN